MVFAPVYTTGINSLSLVPARTHFCPRFRFMCTVLVNGVQRTPDRRLVAPGDADPHQATFFIEHRQAQGLVFGIVGLRAAEPPRPLPLPAPEWRRG